MSNAFNDFLSSVGEGLAGAGSPNMKNYTHATKLYVEGNYARAPKFNHLYFVAFNFNDGVIRDPNWIQSGVREVGLLVKSFSLPRFKIKTEEMNQYNRKTQVQTKLTYDPVTLEFHDDNSEITNGLWKNYYRYYYTDSLYGGKDDTARPTPSQISLGEKLFGGLFRPGSKRTATQPLTKFPDAFTNNKYGSTTYPYGLDNNQDKPFFKSIDVFILHQQKFTQMTLINPKITSWDHDEVSQGESSKVMKNKMTVVYETVLYNDGRIAKGSDSGIFAEAFYDTEASPLSISGRGAASLLGPGGIMAGVEDIFGAGGSIEQGNYLEAILQAATLSKNYDKISKEQLEAEGYSMLTTGLSVVAASKRGEGLNTLSAYYANGGFGIYTNQFSKSNLEEIPTSPLVLAPVAESEVAPVAQPEVAPVAESEVAPAPVVEAAPAAPTLSAEDQDAARALGLAQLAVERDLRSLYGTVFDAKTALGIQTRDSLNQINQITLAIPTAAQLNDPDYIKYTDAYLLAIQKGASETNAFNNTLRDLTALRASGTVQLDILQTIVDGNAKVSKSYDKTLEGVTQEINEINNANSEVNINAILRSKESAAQLDSAITDLKTKTIMSNAVKLEGARAINLGKLLQDSQSQATSLADNQKQLTIVENDLRSANATYNSLLSETVRHWESLADTPTYPIVDYLEAVYFNKSGTTILQTTELDIFTDLKIEDIASSKNITLEEAAIQYRSIVDTGRAKYFAELSEARDKVSKLETRRAELTAGKQTIITETVKTTADISSNQTVIPSNTAPALIFKIAEEAQTQAAETQVKEAIASTNAVTGVGGVRPQDAGPSNSSPPLVLKLGITDKKELETLIDKNNKEITEADKEISAYKARIAQLDKRYVALESENNNLNSYNIYPKIIAGKTIDSQLQTKSEAINSKMLEIIRESHQLLDLIDETKDQQKTRVIYTKDLYQDLITIQKAGQVSEATVPVILTIDADAVRVDPSLTDKKVTVMIEKPELTPRQKAAQAAAQKLIIQNRETRFIDIITQEVIIPNMKDLTPAQMLKRAQELFPGQKITLIMINTIITKRAAAGIPGSGIIRTQ